MGTPPIVELWNVTTYRLNLTCRSASIPSVIVHTWQSEEFFSSWGQWGKKTDVWLFTENTPSGFYRVVVPDWHYFTRKFSSLLFLEILFTIVNLRRIFSSRILVKWIVYGFNIMCHNTTGSLAPWESWSA